MERAPQDSLPVMASWVRRPRSSMAQRRVFSWTISAFFARDYCVFVPWPCRVPLSQERFQETRLQESRPSFSAQAPTTAESVLSVPGVVAQPPFSISARWSHD
jgi:hypothetical protein